MHRSLRVVSAALLLVCIFVASSGEARRGEARSLSLDLALPRQSLVGGAIAYTRVWEDAKGSRHTWITVADLAGQRRLEITKRPTASTPWDDRSPVWSPNGRQLAFVRVWRNGSRAALYVADADGTGLRRVLRLPYDYEYNTSYFSWSPDGRRLAFGNGTLLLVNGDGTGVRRLVTSSACKPSWSPDGRSLVYLVDGGCGGRGSNEWEPGHRAVFRIVADGSGRRILATGSSGDAAWSPDGRRIAFTDRCSVAHGGDWACSAYVMRPDGNGKRKIVEGTWGGGGWGVAWVSGGRELLSPSGSAIRVTVVATGKTRRLFPASFAGGLAGISTSGQRVAVLGEATSYERRNIRPLAIWTVSGRLVRRVSVPGGWESVGAAAYLP
jgi:Tol biopolymer transport system component